MAHGPAGHLLLPVYAPQDGGASTDGGFVLLQDGSYLLLQDGGRIILEDGAAAAPVSVPFRRRPQLTYR